MFIHKYGCNYTGSSHVRCLWCVLETVHWYW